MNFILLLGFLNTECSAESKNSIINLFCIENFKEEMIKANINYDQQIAKDTCDLERNLTTLPEIMMRYKKYISVQDAKKLIGENSEINNV